MITQPEALRLADLLVANHSNGTLEDKAAAELRRLHAANVDCIDHFNSVKADLDVLLDALRDFSDYVRTEQNATDGQVQYSNTQINRLVFKARAAIAEATEGSA